jgi:hypothetical protein
VVVGFIDKLVDSSIVEVGNSTVVVVGNSVSFVVEDNLSLGQILVLDITIIIGTSWVATIVAVIDLVLYKARSCPFLKSSHFSPFLCSS